MKLVHLRIRSKFFHLWMVLTYLFLSYGIVRAEAQDMKKQSGDHVEDSGDSSPDSGAAKRIEMLKEATKHATKVLDEASGTAAAATSSSAQQNVAPPPLPTAMPEISSELSIEESLNLRDPFRRSIKIVDAIQDSTLPELERLPLEQFRITGIITGPKKAKVLVAGPSGKMYILQESSRIGNRKGIIKRIKPRSFVVRERIVNLVGQEESSDVEVKVQEQATASEASSTANGAAKEGGKI